MIKKMGFCFATLALAVASAASTYHITLFQPSVVAGTELQPGQYKLAVDNNKATIKAGKQSVEANVKIEDADRKFTTTSVRYTNGDGKYHVQEIHIGGTHTKLIFEN